MSNETDNKEPLRPGPLDRRIQFPLKRTALFGVLGGVIGLGVSLAYAQFGST